MLCPSTSTKHLDCYHRCFCDHRRPLLSADSIVVPHFNSVDMIVLQPLKLHRVPLAISRLFSICHSRLINPSSLTVSVHKGHLQLEFDGLVAYLVGPLGCLFSCPLVAGSVACIRTVRGLPFFGCFHAGHGHPLLHQFSHVLPRETQLFRQL